MARGARIGLGYGRQRFGSSVNLPLSLLIIRTDAVDVIHQYVVGFVLPIAVVAQLASKIKAGYIAPTYCAT